MGTWGTAIASNDTYADIYSEFCDLYNEGIDVPEITAKLMTAYSEVVNDPDDANNFWFAIAKAQWDYKQADAEILRKVREIIENDSDLEVWRNLGAGEKDVAKRKEVLDKFLAILQSEKPKAKARKKVKTTAPYFEKGECIAFKLKNGNYGGAVVLEAVQESHIGMNLIVTTRINQQDKPTVKDFENAEVIVLNHAAWEDLPAIKWTYPLDKNNPGIEKIGRIDIPKEYKSYSKFLTGSFSCVEQAERQFESEKSKAKSSVTITVKSLIKNKGWKFW